MSGHRGSDSYEVLDHRGLLAHRRSSGQRDVPTHTALPPLTRMCQHHATTRARGNVAPTAARLLARLSGSSARGYSVSCSKSGCICPHCRHLSPKDCCCVATKRGLSQLPGDSPCASWLHWFVGPILLRRCRFLHLPTRHCHRASSSHIPAPHVHVLRSVFR